METWEEDYYWLQDTGGSGLSKKDTYEIGWHAGRQRALKEIELSRQSQQGKQNGTDKED